MTRSAKRGPVTMTQKRYRGANQKQKGLIFNKLSQTFAIKRKFAIRPLNRFTQVVRGLVGIDKGCFDEAAFTGLPGAR
jgi:hypothetical protein